MSRPSNVPDWLKLALSPSLWFIEQVLDKPAPKPPAPQAAPMPWPIPQPKKLSYEIVEACALKEGDVIIHGGSRLYLTKLIQCCGMGNEYGEYIKTEGSYVPLSCDPRTHCKPLSFNLFRHSPTIKVTQIDEQTK